MCDEGVNIRFVMGEEGVDVRLIEEACALRLGQDEIGEEKKAKVGIEGKPCAYVGVISKACSWSPRQDHASQTEMGSKEDAATMTG